MSKFLVIDPGGLHVGTARKFAEEGNEVVYFCSWNSAYPKFDAYAPGVGVEGITKVLDWAPHVDSADCIMFPDVGMGGVADFLRKKGYPVFGAGLGEVLELDRLAANEIYDSVGIKYPTTHSAVGIDAALELIGDLLGEKSETNQVMDGGLFVKFNVWRGSLESFPVADLEQARYMFDSLRAQIGPYARSIPVIIQEKVEGVETGFDGFFDGKDFVQPLMWGFEVGGDYIGRLDRNPSFWQGDLDRIAEYFRKIQYRGYFSMESIFDGDRHYWIDATPRSPMPLGLMWPTFIPSWSDFVMAISKGETPDLGIAPGTYLGCMQIYSEEAKEKYLPLGGGEKTRFMRYMQDPEDGQLYSVPPTYLLGIASASGSTLEEVEQGIQKEAEEVSVYFGEFKTTFLEDAREKFIVPLRELGVDFEEKGSPEESRARRVLQQLR